MDTWRCRCMKQEQRTTQTAESKRKAQKRRRDCNNALAHMYICVSVCVRVSAKTRSNKRGERRRRTNGKIGKRKVQREKKKIRTIAIYSFVVTMKLSFAACALRCMLPTFKDSARGSKLPRCRLALMLPPCLLAFIALLPVRVTAAPCLLPLGTISPAESILMYQDGLLLSNINGLIR